MKLKKYSKKDWKLPELMLRDVHAEPKTNATINRECYKCAGVSAARFMNHLTSCSTQSAYVDFWHCPSCIRSLESYRNRIRENTSKAIKEKFATDKDYVKKVTEARKKYYLKPQDNPKSWTRSRFIEKCIEIHGDKYDYSKVDYQNFRTKVSIICADHGEFLTRPSHHIHFGNGCPQCNVEKLTSIPENKLADWISSVYKGTIKRSDRNVLGGLEIDIWLPDVNVGIEYHGAYFHSFDSNESAYHRNYHSMKSTIAYKSGINLLQFVDIDYNSRTDVAKSMIKNACGLSDRIYARKCSVEIIDNLTAKKFFDDNHYHRGVMPHISFALIYNGTIVSVVSYVKNKTGYDISRFASLLGCCVVGGFSRLMSAFRKYVGSLLVTTFVDRSFTTSEPCYSKYGMNFAGITKPGYRYWKSNRLYNRRSFQKHKLSEKLEYFDPNLTESENMFANGYRRLWDSGNLRYSLKI